MKKIILGLCTITLGLFTYTSLTKAVEERVFIPENSIRKNIISNLNNLENPVLIENDLPTVNDMLMINGEHSEIFGNPERSLEGIQYAKNVRKLNINPSNAIIDYRPISELNNLKEYYSHNSLGVDTDQKDLSISLKPFSSLNSLEKLYLGYANITDLTPLENLSELKSYWSMGSELLLPTVYVSKESKKFIVEQPVKYSSQFTNINITTENNLPIELKNNAIIIDNLDLNTTKVSFTLIGSSENFDWQNGFQATQNFVVPVSWY